MPGFELGSPDQKTRALPLNHGSFTSTINVVILICICMVSVRNDNSAREIDSIYADKIISERIYFVIIITISKKSVLFVIV